MRNIHFRAKVLRKFDAGQRHPRVFKIGFQLRQFDRRAEIPRGELARNIEPLFRDLQIGLRCRAFFLVCPACLFHRTVISCLGCGDLGLGCLDTHRQRIGVEAQENVTLGDGGAFARRHLSNRS